MEVGEACLPTFGGAPRGFRVSRSPGFPGWPAALPGFVGPAFPGLARVRSWVRLLRFRGSCLIRLPQPQPQPASASASVCLQPRPQPQPASASACISLSLSLSLPQHQPASASASACLQPQPSACLGLSLPHPGHSKYGTGTVLWEHEDHEVAHSLLRVIKMWPRNGVLRTRRPGSGLQLAPGIQNHAQEWSSGTSKTTKCCTVGIKRGSPDFAGFRPDPPLWSHEAFFNTIRNLSV